MKAVIMAGGKGTRVSSIANNIPKPMLKIGDKPILEHEILNLKEHGINDIIITVGHLGNVIEDHFGDGKFLDVSISYYVEQLPMGNAGALYEIKDRLCDDFLLLNGDVYFDVDLERFFDFHRKKGGKVSLITHPNSHPYDSGLIVADGTCCVTQWLTKEDVRPQYYKNRVNAGIHIVSPEVLRNRPDTEKVDLDRQILKPLAGTGELFCYDTPEYIKDMGTPERYKAVNNDYCSGFAKSRNLQNKQKAIFLDRDGTINREVGFLRNINDFDLLPDSAKAIKKINDSGYLAVVATNQPVIARGEVTVEELSHIHNKMETLLGNEGAYLDGIYVCPHHPDSGFEGEIKELKINCDCRKPKPGLLLMAEKDLNISLKDSWMIGDRESDIIAGENAGCKTIRVNEELTLLDAVNSIIDGE